MNYNKPLAIILDTNILDLPKDQEEDLSSFNLNVYEEAIELIERSDAIDKISIYIPEIVLKELAEHKKKKITLRLSSLNQVLNDIGKIPGIDIKTKIGDPFNPSKHINDVLKNKGNGLSIIPIPLDKSSLFSEILNMAVVKIPPFQEEKSDKGFKDAILLISIREYFKINKNFKQIVLFSKDNGFSEKIKETIKKDIGIDFDINKTKDIQGYISGILGIFKEFKTFLQDEFYPELKIKISKFSGISYNKVVYSVDKIEINFDGTIIEEILDKEEYSLNVAFDVWVGNGNGLKESFLIDDVRKRYYFKKEDKEWLIRDEKSNYNFY